MRVCSSSFKRGSSRLSGFTLIELLIVIAIILILIAIALPNFLEAQIRAKVARVKGDIRSISVGQESYFQDREVYTSDCQGSVPGCTQLTTPIKYMSHIPFDPFGAHRYGGGWNYYFEGFKRAFYPMGTGTWGTDTYMKTITRGPYSPEEPKVRDAYIIYSAGPTFNYMEPGGPTSYFPMPANELGWTVYSPTNGTTSYGGIIRVGGSLPPAKRPLLLAN